MRTSVSRRGFITRAWLVVLGSLAVMGGLVLLLTQLTRSYRTTADELVVYCAAGLLKPVEEIAAQYEEEYSTRVRVEANNSGGLLSKLAAKPDGADLYVTGEESFVRDARKKDLVAEIIPLSQQRLVLAVAPNNPKKIASIQDLTRDDVRVVLPNPELLAAGRAAQRALGKAWQSLVERTKQTGSRVSLVGTVTEAAQAVKIGAADAAIVWGPTAQQFGLTAVEVSELQKAPAEQTTIGVVAAGKNPTAALHFARYLSARDRGEQVFAKHGFTPIGDADVWQDQPSLVLMSGAMLKPGIDDLVKAFGKREGATINTIYAGCGIHVAQMKAMKKGQMAEAHFPDAYFACDVSFMKQVEEWFDASVVISRNDMVLVVPKGNPQRVRSLEDLARPELRVGLAHPVNSALGALTDDLLKKLNLHARVYAPGRRQPVMHTDAGHMLVNQMRAGALDLIVVYRSNVLSSPENAEKYLEVVEMNLPEAVAKQPYAVARNSDHKYLMRRLLEAILSPASEKHFRESGFQWIAEETSK